MRRFAAKYLYTLQSREPLRNAFVEVDQDGTILRIGPCEEGETLLDGAIVPGFVNAHCHAELSYMKGLFRKGTGMAGFIDQINALRDTSSLETKRACLKEALDQLWEQGVVAMADISNCDDSFALKAEHPLYTRTFLEVFGAQPGECAAVMEGVNALQERAEAFGLDAIGPGIVRQGDFDRLLRTGREADERIPQKGLADAGIALREGSGANGNGIGYPLEVDDLDIAAEAGGGHVAPVGDEVGDAGVAGDAKSVLVRVDIDVLDQQGIVVQQGLMVRNGDAVEQHQGRFVLEDGNLVETGFAADLDLGPVVVRASCTEFAEVFGEDFPHGLQRT